MKESYAVLLDLVHNKREEVHRLREHLRLIDLERQIYRTYRAQQIQLAQLQNNAKQRQLESCRFKISTLKDQKADLQADLQATGAVYELAPRPELPLQEELLAQRQKMIRILQLKRQQHFELAALLQEREAQLLREKAQAQQLGVQSSRVMQQLQGAESKINELSLKVEELGQSRRSLEEYCAELGQKHSMLDGDLDEAKLELQQAMLSRDSAYESRAKLDSAEQQAARRAADYGQRTRLVLAEKQSVLQGLSQMNEQCKQLVQLNQELGRRARQYEARLRTEHRRTAQLQQ